MVTHHPAKFGVHRQCGSGDMLILVKEQECHMPKAEIEEKYTSKFFQSIQKR